MFGHQRLDVAARWLTQSRQTQRADLLEREDRVGDGARRSPRRGIVGAARPSPGPARSRRRRARLIARQPGRAVLVRAR